MRLIDADRLYNTIIDEIDPISISMDGGEMRGMMRTIIAAEPTVDAAPVKHGKWFDAMVGELPVQVCDQCSTFFPLAYTGGGHHYCPNCGAKMDLEETK